MDPRPQARRHPTSGVRKQLVLALHFGPVALSLLLLAGEAWAGTELVVNGDFEEPDVGLVAAYAEEQTFPGWKVETGSVDQVGTYWQAASGKQSIDLSGNEAGAIVQDLSTVRGRTYTLSFAMAGNPEGGSKKKRMQVWWGDKLIDTPSFDTSRHTKSAMGWVDRVYTVTAKGSTTRLKLVGLAKNYYGAAIDRVRVEERASPSPTPTGKKPSPPHDR